MANIYTKDDISLSNKVFFLNGNNLTHVLSVDGTVNPIPSVKLVQNVNKRITNLNDTLTSTYLPKSEFKSNLSSSFRFDDVTKDFRYDSDAKQFVLDVCGRKMTINLADVISSKIITKIEVVEKTSPEGVKYKALRIFFDTEDKDFVDINLNDLVKVYKAGDGINISEDLSISINSEIAKKEYVQQEIESLDSTISNSSNGIIDTITQEGGRLKSFTRRTIISSDFKYSEETGVHESLPIGYIAGLEDKLKYIDEIDWRSLKFNGHISSVATINSWNCLSDMFLNSSGIHDFIEPYNGSFLQIEFTDGLSAKFKNEPDVYYSGDYLILHDHNKAQKIEFDRIKLGKTAFLIRGGVSLSEIEARDASVLLSAKNYTNEICVSLSDCVKNNYFNLNEDETVNGNITFNKDISAYYDRVWDIHYTNLSDKVVIDNTFGSIYNGIANIISECELDNDGITFGLEQPVISAYNTINKIADSKVNVPEAKIDIDTATVEDASNAIKKIVSESTYEIHRNLDTEFTKIDKRFDVIETAVGNHTDRITQLEKRVQELEEKDQDLENRLEAIENFLNANDIIVK